MKENNDLSKIIFKYMEIIHKEWSSDNIYTKFIEEIKELDLKGITIKEIEYIIRPYLYVWGKMGRVLGRVEYEGWENQLLKQIRENKNWLDNFKVKRLSRVNLTEYETEIIVLYESFRTILGNIAATKTLHLICPDFFPPWDNGTASAIRSECQTDNKKIDKFSGEDYYRYLQQLQQFFKRYREVFSNFIKDCERSEAKILDDFLWILVHRPLSIYFE